MNQKIAAVSMVKDECDIVELFVKINLRSVGHLYVIDHCSTDGTSEILKRLVEKGYPITISRNESLDFRQAEVTTALVREVARLDKYDYIVPLDADEFLYCGNQDLWEMLSRQIPAGGCGQMRWVTYAPVNDDFGSRPAPLFDSFRMRRTEPQQFFKVVLSNELAKKCTLAEGNHAVFANGKPVVAAALDVLLQHVPVRTSQQIVIKALHGSHRLSIKPGRVGLEGFHWDKMAQQVRAQNYQLSIADLTDMACRYATDPASNEPAEPVCDSSPRIGAEDDVIEYPDLARYNPLMRFDKLTASLCAEINSLRRQQVKAVEVARRWRTNFATWWKDSWMERDR